MLMNELSKKRKTSHSLSQTPESSMQEYDASENYNQKF